MFQTLISYPCFNLQINRFLWFLYLYKQKSDIMIKEKSTEKLIEYIPTLPNQEQKLITQRISEIKSQTKKKKNPSLKKPKLSALRGRVTKTTSAKIDKQIKSLRNEWQRDI